MAKKKIVTAAKSNSVKKPVSPKTKTTPWAAGVAAAVLPKPLSAPAPVAVPAPIVPAAKKPNSAKQVELHPGIILKSEMKARKLSGLQMAKFLNVPRGRISTLINCNTPMSVDMAYRLARFFNTTPLYWIHMQYTYDLACFASRDGKAIAKEVKPFK